MERLRVSCNNFTGKGDMDSETYCAYNRTRECFLAFEIVGGDFPPVNLDEWIAALKNGSCTGLWMNPFRGIPPSGESVPMDLIYLDPTCRVLDMVEFFPTCRVSASSPPAASVLALPLHSIFTSNTKPGDRLMICEPGDLENRLAMENSLDSFQPTPSVRRPEAELPSAPIPAFAAASPSSTPAMRFPYGGQPAQESALSAPAAPAPARVSAHETLFIETLEKPAPPSRSWIKRLFSPDPPDGRKARRAAAPGLAAYFFTGGAPQAHGIRDVSVTGLYLVTSERWYPGTVIRLTLSRTGGRDFGGNRSISVQARAVRWGNDGVGLEFLPQDSKAAHSSGGIEQEGVNKKQLDEFIARLTTVTR